MKEGPEAMPVQCGALSMGRGQPCAPAEEDEREKGGMA